MEEIKITPLNLLGKDERGITYSFQTKKTGDFIFLTRKAGSLSGNTYHEGKNLGTNPKTFILLDGEIEFNYRSINSTDKKQIKITTPSIIEVKPYTIHNVKALTDFIMLEANSLADIQNDRVKHEV